MFLGLKKRMSEIGRVRKNERTARTTLSLESLEARTLLAVSPLGADSTVFDAEPAVTSGVILVTTVADTIADDGVVSLREAINMAGNGDTIRFAESLKGKTLALSPITISKSITIDASNLYDARNDQPGITISGGSISNTLITVNGGTATSAVNLIGLQFSGTEISVSSANLYGGIILNNGVLNVSNCVFTQNSLSAQNGSFYGGVGIFNQGYLVVSSSSFTESTIGITASSGTSILHGGVIASYGGEMVISDSVISENEITTSVSGTLKIWGAAVFTGNGTSSIIGTTIRENSVPYVAKATTYYYGGGICLGDDSGTPDYLTVTNSLIVNNSLQASTRAYGGGIYSIGTLKVVQSVICNNNAYAHHGYSYGGGIANLWAFDMVQSTVTNNVASSANYYGYGGGLYNGSSANCVVNVKNTILANNTSTYKDAADEVYNAGGKVNGYNVLTSFTGWTASSNIIPYEVQFNSTWTAWINPIVVSFVDEDFQLAENSYAIDCGNNSYAYDFDGNPITVDLNGMSRIANGIVDLGAYEYGAMPPDVGISIRSFTGTYDGKSHGVEIVGMRTGDTVYYSTNNVSYSTEAPTFSNAGTYTVYARVIRNGSVLWTGSSTVSISPRSVVVTAIADNKVYDGTLTGSGSYTLSNILASDTVSLSGGTWTFSNKNVGTNKQVLFKGYSLTGTAASNYTLGTSAVSCKAEIIARQLSISGSTVQEKSYDGTTAAVIIPGKLSGVVAGENVTVAGTGVFANASPGTWNVTVNYTLSGSQASNYSAPVSQILQGTITSDGASSPVDIDGDGFIGPGDRAILSAHWFAIEGDDDWDPICDIDRDGFVGPGDLSYISANWFLTVDDPGFINPPNAMEVPNKPVIQVTGADARSTVVTTYADIVDPNDGLISLREAISYAGDNAVVTFSSHLNGMTITLERGQIDVSKNITIDAVSLSGGITIDGNGDRIFVNNANLTLNNLTLTNGFGIAGGAILNYSELSLENCCLTGNSAGMAGAGLYNWEGTVSIYQCEFTNNQSGNGGAIWNYRGTIHATSCVVTDNVATYSGGAFGNGYGEFVLSNSQITDNTAQNSYGGAAFNMGTLILRNCTVANNSAAMYGGGIINDGDEADLTLYNSIVAMNKATLDGTDIYNFRGAEVAKAYYSLSSFTGWTFSTKAAIYTEGRRLFTSPYSGNYTLVSGAQAVDSGSNVYALDADGGTLSLDLSGGIRIMNGSVDMGAYEYGTVDPELLIRVIDYDGTYDGEGHTVTLEGVLPSDTLLFSADGVSYSTTPVSFVDAGEHLIFIAVTREGISSWVQTAGVNISKKSLTVSIDAEDKVYDGTLTGYGDYFLSGTVGNDVVTLTGGNFTFNTRNAGTNKKVTFNGYSLSGNSAKNYTLANTYVTGTADILQRELTVTGTTVGNKEYDGTIDAQVTVGKVNGIVAGDSVQVNAVGTFDSASVGVHNVQVVYSLGGSSFANYVAPAAETFRAVITGTGSPVDLDGDGFIGPGDRAILSAYWFTAEGDDNWNPVCDIDSDGFAGPGDLSYISANWFLSVDDPGFINPPTPSVLPVGATENGIQPTQAEAPSTMVTTRLDVVNPNDGQISLREAVSYANGGATITFASGLDGMTLSLSNGAITIDKDLVIDASNLKAGLTIDGNGDRIFVNNEVLYLVNLTMINGFGIAGGAILNYGALDLDACILCDNNAGMVGAGIYNWEGTVELHGCEMYCNEAPNGAAIWSYNGELYATDCYFSENYAGDKGGAIGIGKGRAVISNSLITNNCAQTYYGGAIYTMGEVSLYNCTVADNTAGIYGGGVALDGNAAILSIYNTILATNSAGMGGADVHKLYTGETAYAYYSLSSYTEWTSSSGFLTYSSAKKLFNSSARGDYSLTSGSQAVDVGSNDYARDANGAMLTSDLAGETRIINRRVDMGAYEYGAVPPEQMITIVDYDGTYDGQGHTVTLDRVLSGDSILYSSDGISYSNAPVYFTNVGEHTVYVSITRPGLSSWVQTGTVNITKKQISVSITADDKVYDGTQTTTGSYTLSGVVSGDTVTLIGGNYLFSNRSAGTGKTVTFRAYSLGGVSSVNYSLKNLSATASASILQRPLTVSGTTVSDKEYDGTTAAEVHVGKISGIISGDSLAVNAAGVFSSPSIGRHSVEVVYSLSGTLASNYAVPIPETLYATITSSGSPVDVDGDGFIGPGDRAIVSAHWFTAEGDPNWDSTSDIDSDGFVGPGDMSYISVNWFKSVDDPEFINPPIAASLPVVSGKNSFLSADDSEVIFDLVAVAAPTDDISVLRTGASNFGTFYYINSDEVPVSVKETIIDQETFYLELWVTDKDADGRFVTCLQFQLDYDPNQVISVELEDIYAGKYAFDEYVFYDDNEACVKAVQISWLFSESQKWELMKPLINGENAWLLARFMVTVDTDCSATPSFTINGVTDPVSPFVGGYYYVRTGELDPVLDSEVGAVSVPAYSRLWKHSPDIDHNQEIGPGDWSFIATAWHSCPGDETWNELCDINGDLYIDETDLAWIVENWFDSWFVE